MPAVWRAVEVGFGAGAEVAFGAVAEVGSGSGSGSGVAVGDEAEIADWTEAEGAAEGELVEAPFAGGVPSLIFRAIASGGPNSRHILAISDSNASSSFSVEPKKPYHSLAPSSIPNQPFGL